MIIYQIRVVSHMFVSVVMAIYNGEEYVQEAIDSILNQTYTHFEFIIVNDGSTDNTKEILDAINDARVTIIHLEKNKGAANALNIGIAEANGSYIAIQDADDISLPFRLEKQIDYLNKYPELIALGAKIKAIDGKEQVPLTILQGFEKNRNNIINRKQIKSQLYYTSPLTHGSVMFSKQAFIKANGYDPSYKIAYDYDLWMRLSEFGPIENVPEVLYFYRIYPQSLSRQNFDKTNKESIHISTKYIVKHIFPNQKKLTFIVLGSRRKCLIFKNNIIDEVPIHLHCTTDLKYIKLRKVNGVIVLNGANSSRFIQYLQKKGLRMNKNLFHLWVK